ncbi:unnamed protein product [Sphenostylis stenocarpa]|uniref:Uncharacterized protein n=1 Tax=Sphenostylis stenocarpa TaxID=92480 RepID=A0AA86T0S7_9FABA|nr:unnamed protein product [Sphenostylis stenocarpa]
MVHSCVSAKIIDSALHSLEHLPLSQCRKLLHSPMLRNDTHPSLASAPSFQFDTVVREASIQLDFPTSKVKKEIPEDMVYDLDHIVLKEWLRMLLAGKSDYTGAELVKETFETMIVALPVAKMTLIDRLNFLKARADSSLNISTSYPSLRKTRPFSSLSSPFFSKSAEPSSIMCRRKRNKTATDSVQEALEEDAPGLLQVLLDKGVLVDEIKLYGEEADDSHLVNIVFQSLRLIVLERPEYGYATYFFELVESLPVEWQVKRLVIAMKLTACSRISIIENKELVVGEDLSEGEAKVLMEYCWTPNTGLGTMLNSCDRVVHDRKNEGFS